MKNIELDNRTILNNLIRGMSDSDTQQMLAYAAGYEAGRVSQILQCTSEQFNKSPKQTA